MSANSVMLPERPKRKVARGRTTESRSGMQAEAAPAQYASGVSTPESVLMAEKLRRIQQNPALQNLISQPSRITDLISKDPNLRGLFSSNPQLANLLQPHKLEEVLAVARNPEQFIAAQNAGQIAGKNQDLFGLGNLDDLPKHRMNLMQLEAYAQQLQQRMGPSGAPMAASSSPACTSAAPSLLQHQYHQPHCLPHHGSWLSNQHQQNGHSQPLHSGTTARTSGLQMPLRHPLQQAPLFSGRVTDGQDDSEQFQGNFSFSHSNLEVPISSLPEDVQDKIKPMLPPEALEQLQLETSIAKGLGVGGNMMMGPPKLLASGAGATEHSSSGHECNHPSSCTSIPGRMTPAQQRYAELYQDWYNQMQACESQKMLGGDADFTYHDASEMWQAYYKAYPQAAKHPYQGPADLVAQPQPDAVAATHGAAVTSGDPKLYYEPVAPSNWKPEGTDEFLDLYRRAYCARADGAWPPIWACGAYLLCQCAPGMPYWLLLVVLLLSFVAGMYFCSVHLAGLDVKGLQTSRTLCSFIATMEAVYLLVYWGIVLPAWQHCWSLQGILTACCLLALPLLHLASYISDPGYVKAPEQVGDLDVKGEEGKAAVHENEEGTPLVSPGLQAQGPRDLANRPIPGASSMLTIGSAMENSAKQQLQQPWLNPNACMTCKVDKPLRSKHCQLCNKCVHRFDHHCPAVLNCVGEGNHRQFTAYIFTMVIAQVCSIATGLSFLAQLYSQETELQGHRASGEGSGASNKQRMSSGIMGMAAVVGHAATYHRGVLALISLQIPLVVAGAFLASRSLMCILCNLTTNEWYNWRRYVYLNHEAVGYSNRFDRGAWYNCFQFWFKPSVDTWKEFEAGDREMIEKGINMLSVWSPGILLRALDIVQARLKVNAQRKEDERVAKALAKAGQPLTPEQLQLMSQHTIINLHGHQPQD